MTPDNVTRRMTRWLNEEIGQLDIHIRARHRTGRNTAAVASLEERKRAYQTALARLQTIAAEERSRK